MHLIGCTHTGPGLPGAGGNIISAVQADGGMMVPGSYHHSPKHRLLTATGWFRLADDFEEASQRRMRALTTARPHHRSP